MTLIFQDFLVHSLHFRTPSRPEVEFSFHKKRPLHGDNLTPGRWCFRHHVRIQTWRRGAIVWAQRDFGKKSLWFIDFPVSSALSPQSSALSRSQRHKVPQSPFTTEWHGVSQRRMQPNPETNQKPETQELRTIHITSRQPTPERGSILTTRYADVSCLMPEK